MSQSLPGKKANHVTVNPSPEEQEIESALSELWDTAIDIVADKPGSKLHFILTREDSAE